jgi:thiol-disulfide isomerase/thioredoxin
LKNSEKNLLKFQFDELKRNNRLIDLKIGNFDLHASLKLIGDKFKLEEQSQYWNGSFVIRVESFSLILINLLLSGPFYKLLQRSSEKIFIKSPKSFLSSKEVIEDFASFCDPCKKFKHFEIASLNFLGHSFLAEQLKIFGFLNSCNGFTQTQIPAKFSSSFFSMFHYSILHSSNYFCILSW